MNKSSLGFTQPEESRILYYCMYYDDDDGDDGKYSSVCPDHTENIPH